MAGGASRKQNVLVFVAALAIIILSVVATLFVSERMANGGFGSSGKDGYQNITFTDAVVTCRDYTDSSFGGRQRTLEVDDHSSRFDQREFLYKIFLKVETPTQKGTGLALHYVNCFVSSSSGRISKFEAYEDKEESVSPVTENDTNMFGWPR
ncbi:hypothetical protein [Teredinibacter haidensis]|uniref:hypothetical protein n=1 Tax=Teredinibacter haidensis TaxID=2731755 RepID=UPI0009489255|nr:hypothetical protein [Teredinibacter haidensis]